MTQVSVIVPVRDDAPRLRRCLAALRAQTVDHEVVVVDNGSRDDVAGAVVAAGGPAVRLLHEPRPGSYAARNRGLAAARGAVLAFTDADCLPEPGWLERGLARLAAPPEVDLVAGAIAVFPARRARPNPLERYDMLTAFPQRHFVERYGFGATANLLVRRRVFDRVGPFAGALRSGGDAEWGERATAAGFRVAFAEDVVVHHPARGTVAELVEKMTRTTRGVEDLAALRGQRRALPLVAGQRLVRPWLGVPRLLRDPRVPLSAKPGFLAVDLLANLLAAAEMTRGRLVRGPRP